MRHHVKVRNIARFAIVSGIFVAMALILAVALNQLGAGLSATEIMDSAPIILSLYFLWIILVGVVRGWIRFIE